jgi:transposase
MDLGLIWQTDDGTQTLGEDTDTILVLDGRIATALTFEDLAKLAARHGLVLEDFEGPQVDLDGLGQLLELLATEGICTQMSDAWNLYGDIARSVEATLGDVGAEAHRWYDKLFASTNSPAVAPAGEDYRSDFTGAKQQLTHPRRPHPRPRHPRHLPLTACPFRMNAEGLDQKDPGHIGTVRTNRSNCVPLLYVALDGRPYREDPGERLSMSVERHRHTANQLGEPDLYPGRG